MLKDIIKNLEPSSTLKINETSKFLEEKGKTIFKFGFGQSPFQVPIDIVNELKNNAHQNKYLPMQGLVDLRRSVAKYTSDKKNFDYTFEDVIIGPGSKELMFLLHVICVCYEEMNSKLSNSKPDEFFIKVIKFSSLSLFPIKDNNRCEINDKIRIHSLHYYYCVHKLHNSSLNIIRFSLEFPNRNAEMLLFFGY